MKDTVRAAARHRKPLDGTDAQALEGALQQAERELNEVLQVLHEVLRTGGQMEKLPGSVWDASSHRIAKERAAIIVERHIVRRLAEHIL